MSGGRLIAIVSAVAAAALPSPARGDAGPAGTSSTSRPLLSAAIDLEYRVQHHLMRPLSLNDLSAASVSAFDQRGRAGVSLGIGERVRIRVLVDFLEGVLFGDNGTFRGEPPSNRGAIVGAKAPNLARLAVDRLDDELPSLDIDSYGLVLVEAEPVTIRALYGEVLLPFGLLRAGRQPLATGRSVLVHDGTRINRWGVSKNPDTADGIAFGTKLSAIGDAIAGDPVDTSEAHGLFAGLMFAQPVEGLPNLNDDLYQLAATVWFKRPETELLGLEIPNLDGGLVYSYRIGDQFDTQLHTVTAYLNLDLGAVSIAAAHAQMIGETREISEGLAALGRTSGPPALQPITAFGGFAELAYRPVAPFTLIFGLFYASGDDDPSSDTSITQLTFAEDTNVGLHLFENVIAYQSARSAQLGVENIRAIDPPSLPVEQIDTRGGLSNAIVLFPQVILTPLSWLDARAGVMFAFAHTPVVDPIQTILRSDGLTLEDDKVNFNGGPPGTYWGTEIDLGLTLRPADGFLLDLEGAYLFPGDALRDENGDAVDSIFVNARFTYFFDGLTSL